MMRRRRQAFTIIELMVVLAALGLLLSIAAPRFVQHVDHAREVALKQDLQQMRVALDQFHADQGRYPTSLNELVSRRYLRSVPVDPITERTDTWQVSPASGQDAGTIADLRSGATGLAQDGSAYASW